MIRKGMFISDRYEIIDKVGSGGMSDVYKAKDHKLNRFVAVKVLKQEFSQDKSFVSKFKAEAQSAAGLTHPNIVNVYDVGEDEGIYYIVMELIEGITLKKYIEKKGKLPVKEAVSIAIQVAQGIEAAHNNHIIHRDIKSQNIMISREGKVKVTDFGIARAASTHTINGNAMGSVHYISPEQAKGGYIDEKSDIYSLGITLYEMVTGTVPFEGDTTVSVALQHINEEMPNPKQTVPDLPVSVEKIILKCTQKKPERRYLKVSSLIADLKKSLITPDEDFVQLVPSAAGGNTVLITDDEVSVIKKEADDIENQEDKDYEDNLSDDDDVFGDDDDIDSVSPKLDKIITISGIVGAVVVAIVVILVLIKAFGGCDSETGTPNETDATQETSISDKQTVVPNVVGKTEEEAIELLKDRKLGYKIEKREANNTYPKGYVILQSEDADTVVDKNSTINLTVSDGPEEITVPSVAGKTKEEAKEILEGEEYGLIVEYEYEINEEIEAEKVISTKPEANEKANYGDTIVVVVSQGADTSNVDVPDLKNKTKEAAEAELAELGLSLEVIKETDSDTVDAGKIINQNIEQGKNVPRGTVIGVTISTGRKEPETTTEAPTEAPTTISNERTVTFAGIKYADTSAGSITVLDSTGKETTLTGTLTAEFTYTNIYGETSTASVGLDSSEISESWSQGQLTFTRETNQNSEAKLTIYLTYKTYEPEEDAEGNVTYKEVTKENVSIYTDTAVFQ